MYVTVLGSIVTEFSDLKFDWYVNIVSSLFQFTPFFGLSFSGARDIYQNYQPWKCS